jgi:hypothetical protein
MDDAADNGRQTTLERLRCNIVNRPNNPHTCNDLDPDENPSPLAFVKTGTRLASRSSMMLNDVNSDSTH